MKTSRRSKIKISAQHLFILALLLALAWYLAFDPGVEEATGSFALTVMWILVVSSILIVSIRWYNQLKGLKIYPFLNATGDREHKEMFDAFAQNFTALLQLEIQQINQLLNTSYITPSNWSMEQTAPVSATRHDIRGSTLTKVLKAPSTMALKGRTVTPVKTSVIGAEAFNLVVSRIDEEISETLKDVGGIDVGPVNLPLGGLLSLLTRALRGPGITGSIQKYGESITVVASYENRKWEVSYDLSLAEDKLVELAAIRDLAHQLAIKMVSEVGEHSTANWRSFDGLVKGLDLFQQYLQSGMSNLRALEAAKEQFKKSALFDEQFGLVYYFLGLAYEGQEEYKTAIEMYRLAVQADPKLREGYLRLGVLHALGEQYADAIDAAKRAIEFAVEAKQPFPEARDYLGTWLVTQAEGAFQLGNVSDAIDTCRRGIKQLYLAIEEYKKSVRGVQRLRGFSVQQQSNMREKQIEVQIHLSRAYSSLADYLEQEEGAKLFDRGRANQYRKKAEGILKESLKLNPNKAETHTVLAGYYISQGDFSRARKQLEHVIGIRPEDISIHLDIGTLYLEPASKKIPRIVEVFLENSQALLDEWDDKKIKEIYQQLQAADWHFQNVLDIIRQKTIGSEENTDETVQAIKGQANVSGPYALFNMIHDSVLGIAPDYNEYSQNVQYAEALLGKALGMDPFDVGVYSDLEGAYGVEGYILEHCLSYAENKEMVEYDIDTMQARLAQVENTRQAYTNILGVFETYDNLPAEQAFPELIYAIAALALSSPEQRQNKNLVDPLVVDEELEKLLAGVDDGEETRIYLWVVGWMLYHWQEFEACRPFIETALQKDGFVEANLVPYDLGNLYYNLGYYERAIDRYLDVEAYDPFFWQSRLALIDIYNLLEQTEQISITEKVAGDEEEPLTREDVLQLAVDAAWNNPNRLAWAFVSLADYYHSEKDYDKAILYCKEAIRLIPGYSYPYIVLAFIYMDLQDYKRAIENWKRMGDLNPHQDMHLYHLGLGDAYFNQGLDTSDPEARVRLIRKGVAEYKTAIDLFEANEVEDEAVTLAVMGQALVELGEYKQAELAYHSAMQLQRASPEMNNLHTQLAYTYVKQKQFWIARQEYLNAIHFCQEMIELAEEGEDQGMIDRYRQGLAHARNLLAFYVYAERGINLEEGLDLINQALDDLEALSYSTGETEDLMGAFLDTRGWIHFKMGDYQDAYNDLEEAISLTMGTEYEHAHMALVCGRLASLSDDEKEKERLHLKAREQKALAIDLAKEGVWDQVSVLYWEEGEA